MLENPNLRNTLAKTLICNSLGQHKDERNAARHQIEGGTPAASRPKRQTITVPCIEDVAVVTTAHAAIDDDENTFDLY